MTINFDAHNYLMYMSIYQYNTLCLTYVWDYDFIYVERETLGA